MKLSTKLLPSGRIRMNMTIDIGARSPGDVVAFLKDRHDLIQLLDYSGPTWDDVDSYRPKPEDLQPVKAADVQPWVLYWTRPWPDHPEMMEYVHYTATGRDTDGTVLLQQDGCAADRHDPEAQGWFVEVSHG